MIHLSGCKLQAGSYVLGLKIRKVFKDFRLGGSTSQHFEDVLNADAHAADTSAPPALLWVKGDAI
jgi:hypothetical protein